MGGFATPGKSFPALWCRTWTLISCIVRCDSLVCAEDALPVKHQLVLNGCLNASRSPCWPSLLSKLPHWSLAKTVLLIEWIYKENTFLPAGMPLAYLHVGLGWPSTHFHTSIQVHVLFASFNFYNTTFALYAFSSAYLLLRVIGSPRWVSELRLLAKTSNLASVLHKS